MRKTAWILGCLLLAAIGPFSAKAQLGDIGGSNPLTQAFGDDFFDNVSADLIEYSTTGAFELTGKVDFKSPRLSLQCARLIGHSDTKEIFAEGGPVKIRQGEDMRAECKKFNYDTETKTSVLTGGAVIKQKDGRKTTTTRGDRITIRQAKDGEYSISVEMLPGSSQRPEIWIDEEPVLAEAGAVKEKSKPEPVDKKNLDILKLPQREF